MPDSVTGVISIDPELQMLQNNSQEGHDYRQRRDNEWIENYTLSRDKVIVNRLTQRQTVNLPVMKTVLRTLMKDVDDMPAIYFQNLNNDKEAEIVKNEYWKFTGDEMHNKFELQDIIDKRQVFGFGRSYDQWQIVDGLPVFNIIDTRDMWIPRYNDPINIDNNSFLIHGNIFIPLDDLKNNPEYDKTALNDLAQWYGTQDGLIKLADNQDKLEDKNKLLQRMGDQNTENPILGRTVVQLEQQLVWKLTPGSKKPEIYVYTIAENMKILRKKPLDQIIGSTKDDYWKYHFPYDSWADEPEKQDWYSDGIADIVRPTARVVNVWWSQMVENRTMRSFGMNLYNSSIEGWQPQTWEAKPWGWYGIPIPQGQKMDEIYKNIEIPGLGDSLNEMNFAITMIEKATGATATQQGAENQKNITLGEVQLALTEAKERIKGMSKFYTQVWIERGYKFCKMVEAGEDKLDAVQLFKKGRQTDSIYPREVDPRDWKSKLGYGVKVWSQDQKDAESEAGIQKASAIKTNMPDNPVVDMVFKRKLLEFGDYTPDELNDALAYEEQKRNALLNGATNPLLTVGTPLDPALHTGKPSPKPAAPQVPGAVA